MQGGQRLIILVCLFVACLSSYNESKASTLLIYSKIAYESKQSINKWTCTQCADFPLTHISLLHDQSQTNQAFTGYSSLLDAFIISFRGSNNIKNWINNMQIFTTNYSSKECINCAVHRGFYTVAKNMESGVSNAISKLIAELGNKKVYLTGHSLGGALAIFYSLSFRAKFSEDLQVYTYGQPRVGHKNFGEFCDRKVRSIYRIINRGDMIAHMPLKKQNYHHSGWEIWYFKGQQSYASCTGDITKKCSNALLFLQLNPAHHAIQQYLQLFNLTNNQLQTGPSWQPTLNEKLQLHLSRRLKGDRRLQIYAD